MSRTELSPCIFVRTSQCEQAEMDSMSQYFPVFKQRTDIARGSLVIGRFSVLPYHREVEYDIVRLGSKMINSTAQHEYVANFDYYADIADVTFPTWFALSDVPFHLRNAPFIVKGRTNSKKQAWSRLMYAPNFAAASNIAAELRCDGVLGEQGIIARQYVPLETFEISEINGMPFSNEWRIFYYQGARLAYGYYWSLLEDWAPVHLAMPNFLAEGLPFADGVAQRLIDKIPFVVIDIARTQEGQWRVVELNDGCQSGLNDSVPADMLYGALRQVLKSG
jgi:hypothetical protein